VPTYTVTYEGVKTKAYEGEDLSFKVKLDRPAEADLYLGADIENPGNQISYRDVTDGNNQFGLGANMGDTRSTVYFAKGQQEVLVTYKTLVDEYKEPDEYIRVKAAWVTGPNFKDANVATSNELLLHLMDSSTKPAELPSAPLPTEKPVNVAQKDPLTGMTFVINGNNNIVNFGTLTQNTFNITTNVTVNTINGSSKWDTLTGTAKNDLIWGLQGADTIKGGGGDDTLRAGQGHDRVYGGTGKNELYGGRGNDAFYITREAVEASADIIRDFNAGDRIVMPGATNVSYATQNNGIGIYDQGILQVFVEGSNLDRSSVLGNVYTA
jgi:hypothetical protein